MSERLLQLGAALKEKRGIRSEAGEEMIEVSLPASRAATLYEKARSAIDYQEEHLLRRNAIMRIIKRYAGSDSTISEISERLLRELIWAKYLPNKTVPTRFIGFLVPIFEKYEPIIRSLNEYEEGEMAKLFDWLMQVLATEIEYAITPPVHAEALASFMYDEMRERIEWDARLDITPEQKDLFIYIAIHRSLLKSDDATLRFRVLTLYYPAWPGEAPKELSDNIRLNLRTVTETIDGYINHPIVERLSILMRRQCGIFNNLLNAFEEEPEKMVKAIEDPAKMDAEVNKALKRRTKTFREVSRRTVMRSIVFLLITKSMVALGLELPFELIIYGHFNYIPTLINVSFPPFLLGLIALTISLPERKNTADYISATRALLIGADHDLLNVRVKIKHRSAWTVLFNMIYAVTYLFIFGFISLALLLINFTWLSISIFCLFLCFVAYFGVRIRSSVKDVVLSTQYRGLFGSIFDLFTVPVVNAGRWLSNNFSKINIFIYFFDFILEAPVKVVIRFFEGWTEYIREKREEL